MEKNGSAKNRKIIIIMLIEVIIMAIICLIIYIPMELGYSNLDCNELINESDLLSKAINFCSNDVDCRISTDIVLHMCGCYELINKNTDISDLQNKKTLIENLYSEKHCPVQSCDICKIPIQDEIKCIHKKCVAEFH